MRFLLNVTQIHSYFGSVNRNLTRLSFKQIAKYKITKAPFTIVQNKKKWNTNSYLHQNCKHIFCALKGWETVSITSTAFSIKATKQLNLYLFLDSHTETDTYFIFFTFASKINVIKHVCCDSSHYCLTHLKPNTGCENNTNVWCILTGLQFRMEGFWAVHVCFVTGCSA